MANKRFDVITLRGKLRLNVAFWVMILIGISGNLLYRSGLLTRSFDDLKANNEQVVLLHELQHQNSNRSDAVKNYLLTGDASWAVVFDEKSILVKDLTEKLKKYEDVYGEKFREYEGVAKKVEGVELLILSKIRDEDLEAGLKLYDDNYEDAQLRAAELIDEMVHSSSSQFKNSLTENVTQVGLARDVLLIVISVFMIVAVVFSRYITRAISVPIERMMDSVGKISAGDLSARVDWESRDELGELGGSINKMAEELNASYKNLEHKVQERTEELSVKVKLLGSTKKAMINLLEDARGLEGELVKEKELVEQKVEERTKELEEAKVKVSEGWLQQREEKARLLASINSLPLGFFLLDNEHNLLASNSALKKILGIEQKVSYEVLEEVFEKCGVDIKMTCSHCRGDLKPFEKSDVKYHDKFLRFFSTPAVENDKLVGSVVLVEDITEAKLLDRAKEEFFSIASHELRTPLTAIRGNASMMQEYFGEVLDKNKDMSEMVDDMHAGSVRLIGIVNDFLDSSRLEQGRVSFKKEKFDLVKVIDDVMENIQVNAKEKGLVLKRTEDVAQLPWVLADPERTQQVLYNIIGNAVNYTKQGGVIVNISQAGNNLRVRVADTGVGITPQNQRLLFRKFQQAGERVLARDVTKGTGLGLYISKLLAKGMGGDVVLEKSEVGKGSIFAIILPGVI